MEKSSGVVDFEHRRRVKEWPSRGEKSSGVVDFEHRRRVKEWPSHVEKSSGVVDFPHLHIAVQIKLNID